MALALGVFAGLVILIFKISNAFSYLSDDPAACMNCHVMAPQYATWERGSHGRNTVCNDCHVPHNSIVSKYVFKASDGLRHSFMFTFHLEPQVIRVKEAGIGVIQENCIRCHESLVGGVSIVTVTGKNSAHGGGSPRPDGTACEGGGAGRLCWECHRETPHGRVSSLSSVPYARIPRLPPVVPEWLENRTSLSIRKAP